MSDLNSFVLSVAQGNMEVALFAPFVEGVHAQLLPGQGEEFDNPYPNNPGYRETFNNAALAARRGMMNLDARELEALRKEVFVLRLHGRVSPYSWAKTGFLGPHIPGVALQRARAKWAYKRALATNKLPPKACWRLPMGGMA